MAKEISLKKFYRRNHARESQFGSFFSDTSSNLLMAQHIWISIFLTPALIATSFISKDIIIMIANMLLSISYLSHFFYRVFNKDISTTEMVMTALCIGGLIALSLYFAPAFGLVGALAVIAKLNLVATSINGFFLIKNILIPPLKTLVDKVCLKLNFKTSLDYYHQPPLTREIDAHVINYLFQAHYQCGIETIESDSDDRLKRFNHLLKVLCQYMNKYHAMPFGYLRRNREITSLETKINEIITEGRAGNAYLFIRKKIAFKDAKLQLLEKAKSEIMLQQSESAPNKAILSKYFNYSTTSTHDSTFFSKAIQLLDSEIAKQSQKKESLENALPQARM